VSGKEGEAHLQCDRSAASKKMESSSTSALPARGPKTIKAATSMLARETNVTDLLEASEAREAQETSSPSLQEVPRTGGVWETNTSEKEPATARSGEELPTIKAQVRGKEEVANRHQAAAKSKGYCATRKRRRREDPRQPAPWPDQTARRTRTDPSMKGLERSGPNRRIPIRDPWRRQHCIKTRTWSTR
jgi:hypothetical protein